MEMKLGKDYNGNPIEWDEIGDMYVSHNVLALYEIGKRERQDVFRTLYDSFIHSLSLSDTEALQNLLGTMDWEQYVEPLNEREALFKLSENDLYALSYRDGKFVPYSIAEESGHTLFIDYNDGIEDIIVNSKPNGLISGEVMGIRMVIKKQKT